MPRKFLVRIKQATPLGRSTNLVNRYSACLIETGMVISDEVLRTRKIDSDPSMRQSLLLFRLNFQISNGKILLGFIVRFRFDNHSFIFRW